MIRGFWRVALPFLALLSVLLVVPALAAQTTEPAKPEAAATAQASQEGKAATQHEEEKKEDENDAFKQSPSVKWLARHTGLSVKWAYWLSMVLNFAVVAAVIFWFSKSRLPEMFRARTTAIQKSIEEARTASAEAQRRLSEIEARLGRLDAEITVLRVNADAAAKAEEERIRQATEEERQKIVRTAEQEIASAAGVARRELKMLAAELAISLAEKKIRVEPAADDAMVRDFVSQLRPEGK